MAGLRFQACHIFKSLSFKYRQPITSAGSVSFTLSAVVESAMPNLRIQRARDGTWAGTKIQWDSDFGTHSGSWNQFPMDT